MPGGKLSEIWHAWSIQSGFRVRVRVRVRERVVLRAHDEPVGALDDVGDAVVRRRAADGLG